VNIEKSFTFTINWQICSQKKENIYEFKKGSNEKFGKLMKL